MTDFAGTDIFRLEDAWTYKVNVLADLVSKRITGIVQQTAGLNLSQWRVLAAIADRPGRTATEVVDVTPMDKGLVSRAVATLVGKNMIARQASDRDGRLALLFLTPEGERTYQSLVRELDLTGASGRRAFDEVTERRLLTLLDKVIEAYRSDVP